MKKLLFVAVGFVSLCAFGQGTARAGSDEISDAPPRRHVYVERDDCYPRRTVVVAPYCAPGYYAYGYRPHYYRRHVGFFLPVPPPPVPVPFVRF